MWQIICIEKNPVTSGLEGGQKEAMTDFAFNDLADKVGGFKKESNENFFLNYLGKDKGLLRRRIGQTILFRSNEKYNFDFIKSKDSQKQVEESSKSN